MDLLSFYVDYNITKMKHSILLGILPSILFGGGVLLGILFGNENYLNSDNETKKNSVKSFHYEGNLTRYNPSIDPRGFLGIENFNASLERLDSLEKLVN